MTSLVLITGFLGAGKTTLLRQMIPQLKKEDLRMSVILNDYANADLDSASLREMIDDITPISGSCVCCGSLDEVLMTLEDVDLDRTDVVLVETNGTTDPLPLIETLVLHEAGQRFGALMQIHVVDCKRWQRRESSNALERQQTRSASHALFSWENGLSESRRETVRNEVRQLNSRVRETTLENFCEELTQLSQVAEEALPRTFVSIVDPRKANRLGLPGALNPGSSKVSQQERQFDVARKGLKADHHHHHDASHALAHRYTALQFELPRELDPGDFWDWLDTLPPNVIRAKGIVELADMPGRFHYFQRVETELSVKDLDFRPPHDITLALLVGIELDEASLRQRLPVRRTRQADGQHS